MGYTTRFKGELKLNQPLTHLQWVELSELADYEHDTYKKYTDTPETIPKSYLQWEPNREGTAIVWNGGEKFYNYVHWLRWLIKHYMKPNGLVLNGELTWQGEEIGDTGVLTCKDNVVTSKKINIKDLVECPNCGTEFVPNN